MQFKALKTGIVALLLSTGAHAEWTLDGAASSLLLELPFKVLY